MKDFKLRLTGTEMLMKLMEEWHRQGEPHEVIIAFVDSNGEADYRINCLHTRALGLAHFALTGSSDAIRGTTYAPTPKPKDTTQ
jgi:hypothetical protein